MGFKPQEPLEQIHQRKQCRVLRVLCTPTLPAYMWFVGNMLLEHLYQPALAYACIPSEQDPLSVPSFDLCPAFKQYTDLLFSTDQRCESSGLSHIQATSGTILAATLGVSPRASCSCLPPPPIAPTTTSPV